MTLEVLKQSLRIDGNYNDFHISSLMESAKASLKATIGYNEDSELEDSTAFNQLQDTFITEYVRGLYFQIDNQKTLDALQMQLQSFIKSEDV